jgi:hypothetical protein
VTLLKACARSWTSLILRDPDKILTNATWKNSFDHKVVANQP